MKLKRYRVEKINGKMVVTEDRKGNYRAVSGEEIKMALTEPHFQTTTAEVLTGRTWHPLRRSETPKHRGRPPKRKLVSPPPIKQKASLLIKILKRLHLYRDPLEKLIYCPRRDGSLPKIANQ